MGAYHGAEVDRYKGWMWVEKKKRHGPIVGEWMDNPRLKSARPPRSPFRARAYLYYLPPCTMISTADLAAADEEV